MRFSAVCLIVVAATACDEVTFPAAVPTEVFEATLNGDNEIPPVATGATAVAVFSVVDDSFFNYAVSVAGADSVTQAHIHEGDATVAGGPILVTLFTAPTAGCKQNVDTTLTITSSSAGNPTTIKLPGKHGLTVGSTALMRIAGHAGSTPSLNGEHTATITGDSTFSIPVDVTVGGTGGTSRRFNLINRTSPRCRLAYSGALSQTQVKMRLLSTTGANARYATYGTTARERFDSLLVRMRNGTVYVNVHNPANPAGHIRGQIGPR
jgi:CHRD domain